MIIAFQHVQMFAILTIASVTYACALRRVERLRRAVTSDRVPNLLSVWLLAAVVLLPSWLLLAATMVFYAAEWPSRRAVGNGRPGRYLYSWAATAAAAQASSVVLHSLNVVLSIPLAIIAFTAVNIAVISIGMIVRHQKAVALEMFSKPRAHLVEFAGQGMGLVLGEALLRRQPLAVLVLPLLYIAHRYAAQDAHETSGAYDPVMRLWNEAGWSFQAAELISSGKFVTVFAIDGDAGKSVVADIIRPCLTRSAVLGHSDSHVIAICETFSPAAAQVIVRRTVAALERSAADLPLGSRTARCEDLSEMLTHALSDLMAARDRAGTASRW